MVPRGPFPPVDPNSMVSYTVVRIETQKLPSLSYSDNLFCTQTLPMVKTLPNVFVDPSHTFEACTLKFDLFFPFVHLFRGDMLY
jgi:hypothetical protein